MARLTKDMLGWCYALDVVKWLSNDANRTGDYTAVEVIALSNAGEVLVVPDDEYEASVIYSAMMHLAALPSFIDNWHMVGWDGFILTFYCEGKQDEYANCKYNPFYDGTKTICSREYLEAIWKRMRT